jgi:hypothetical protein
VPSSYFTDREAISRDHRPVTFVVCNRLAPSGGVTPQAATATFGPPETTYRTGPVTILVWARDLAPQLLSFPPSKV